MADRSNSFLIAWSQTRVDGVRGPTTAAVETGATWSWAGQALALDLPVPGLLSHGSDAFRRRAIASVRRLLSHALPPVRPVNGCDFGEVTTSRDFVVSCGRAAYRVTLVEVPEAARPLLLFVGERPPKGRPLRIIDGLYPASCAFGPVPELGGVICFTPGTRLRTPGGDRPVESLQEGDMVETRDGGAQEILWIGRRRLSGAQMHAMPELRPIRICGAALGENTSDADLVVSPRHRVVLKGDAARALFGTPEVLVAAEDLRTGATLTRDHQPRDVSYIHLLLPRHHIVWANEVETESFHPASTDLRTVEPEEFQRLSRIVPGVDIDPRSYGDPVRRELNRTESRAFLAEAGLLH